MLYRNELETIGHIGNINIQNTNGKKIAFVSVAVNSFYKDRETQETRQHTDWVSWKFFNESTVAYIEQYAEKGQHVCIRGKVTPDTHEVEGRKVYKGMQCIGKRFSFVQPKPQGQDYPEPGSHEPEDGDMPF